ncbi:MAG: hypothetical protein ACREEM_45710 [Blastocatellia bacterium]
MKRLLWSCTKLNGSASAGSLRLRIGVVLLMLAGGIYLARGIASGHGQSLHGNDDFNAQDWRFCTQTAETLFRACGNEVEDDFLVTSAKCANLSDDKERAECLEDAQTARREGADKCGRQRAGRRETCALIGEERYDPDLDPDDFETDFTNPRNPNPYFPLKIGNRWEYRGGTESNLLEVLNETKLIEGVTAVVVDDQVFENGILKEDTDDWYAQAKDRNVWYLGEEVKDFESFDGDKPRKPELVSISGSFKEGRNGDRAGVIFQASPRAGQAYLEEFSLGNAEDVTVILSTTYAYGRDRELDRFMPRPLADRFCSGGDCVVTRNFSLLEPGVFARKYYARGIGAFFEVNPDTGKFSQLVNCNFDLRCQGLGELLPGPGLGVTNIFPAAGQRGQRVNLTVLGAGFTPQSQVSLSGLGVRIFTQFLSNTRLNASLLISDNAFASSRDLTVKNPGGDSTTRADAFMIRP